MAKRPDMQQINSLYSGRNAGERTPRSGSAGRAGANASSRDTNRTSASQRQRALTPREKAEMSAASTAQSGTRRTTQRTTVSNDYREQAAEQRSQRSASRSNATTSDRRQRAATGDRTRQRSTAAGVRSSRQRVSAEETTSRRSTGTTRPTRTSMDQRGSRMSEEPRRYRSARTDETQQREQRRSADAQQQRRTRRPAEDGSVRRHVRSTRSLQDTQRSSVERGEERRRQRVSAEENKRVVSRETIEEQVAKRLPNKEMLSDKEALVSGAKDKLSGLVSAAQKAAAGASKKEDDGKKKKEEDSPYILPSFFLGLIAALLVLGLVIPDTDFSQTENRKLQTMPALTPATFADASFQDDFQTYVEDQFPFRDFWVSLKSVVATMSGRVENNGVYRCGDGTLILEFVAPEKDSAADAIVKFTEAHKKDMNIYTLVAPTAAGIWKDKLPGQVVMDDQKSYLDGINTRFSNAGAKVVDVWKPFDAKKDFDLFYRTDHHWTTYGAHLAYMNFANQIDMNVSYKTYNDLIMKKDFSGSLTAQGGYFLSGSEELHVYLRSDQDIPCVVTYASEKTKSASPFVSSALDQRDSYQVFFGGNHALIQIDSFAENSRGTLLVVKDSYANCFIPFLIGDYERIIVVDPRYYNEDIESLIASNNVKEVLFLYNATTFAQDNSLSRLIDAGLSTKANEDKDKDK